MKRKRRSLRARAWIAGLVAVAMIVVMALTSSGGRTPAGGKLRVVAAEDFWGSLVSQLGGNEVSVTNLVSDPNADPHEYESNPSVARGFALADYVVLNGAGYDAWGNKLLSAGGSDHRTVLTVAELLGKKNGDNPHFWYEPGAVNRVVAQMDADLIALRPSQKAYFEQRLHAVQASLAPYQNRLADIRQHFAGVKVAATEDIFAYVANATGLDLISPAAFTQAVAEGNDPPAASVATFQRQLQNREPAVLIYNEQTVTPLTTSVRQLAGQNGIPVVGIAEIMPPAETFQSWMNAELTALEQALQSGTLK